MSSDIVERLRAEHTAAVPLTGRPTIFAEAADEIEQLRAANADLRDDIEVLVDHRVEYKAEIEQLRAALVPFAADTIEQLRERVVDLEQDVEGADRLVEQLRAALTEIRAAACGDCLSWEIADSVLGAADEQ